MERWVKYATKLAATSTEKFRISAICFDKRGKILSRGVNSYTRTHPRQKALALGVGFPSRQYLHAEIAALVRCRKQPYKILICRIDKKGETRMAAPCVVCRRAIQEAGIKVIEYTT